MIAVVQRVRSASVRVASDEVARIGAGFLVLAGVRKGDGSGDIAYLARKIAGLRVFADEAGKMNRAIADPGVGGEILAVSQFTLLGDVRKGRRPSFDKAEIPEEANQRFEQFVEALRAEGLTVQCGVFGALMQVSLVNDGPVTFVIDSRAG